MAAVAARKLSAVLRLAVSHGGGNCRLRLHRGRSVHWPLAHSLHDSDSRWSTAANDKRGGEPPPPRADKRTTEEEWRLLLSAQQYSILREKATEEPHSGEYNRTDDEGVYRCAGCGHELYVSDTKFNSACGWPAFYEEMPGAVERHEDRSLGLTRTEITCSNCGSHLGHVFEGEGFPTPTDQRHCVNSLALDLERRPLRDSERRTNDVLDALRWAGEQ